MGMNRIYTEITKRFGEEVGRWSVVGPEGGYDQMVDLLDTAYHGGTIVEIGTLCGASTVLLAQYAPKVITIDIWPRMFRERCKSRRYPAVQDGIWRDVWQYMGVADKIEERIVDPLKPLDLSGDDFTLAFIDGDHTESGVKRDFDAVNQCGTVIFHDYDCRDEPVTEFVDRLDGDITRRPPLALWRAVS